MGSQLDLDQGGTFRQKQRVYMGPSVGWIEAAFQYVLPVTIGGLTTILLGNTLVLVNFAGVVSLQLPSGKSSAAGAQAIPGSFIGKPITIVDSGGNASGANAITILAPAGETIDGLASIKIQTAYGAFVLTPNITSAAGGYTLTQS